MSRFNKYNKPKERAFGAETKHCRICGNTHAHVNKYGIHLCRKCFREIAPKIGFKKFS